MPYEAADGFLSGEKTGGIIFITARRKTENTHKATLFQRQKGNWAAGTVVEPGMFSPEFFLSREVQTRPGSFSATPLLSNDIVLKCYVFKVKCQNREGVCVIYIYT